MLVYTKLMAVLANYEIRGSERLPNKRKLVSSSPKTYNNVYIALAAPAREVRFRH